MHWHANVVVSRCTFACKHVFLSTPHYARAESNLKKGKKKKKESSRGSLISKIERLWVWTSQAIILDWRLLNPPKFVRPSDRRLCAGFYVYVSALIPSRRGRGKYTDRYSCISLLQEMCLLSGFCWGKYVCNFILFRVHLHHSKENYVAKFSVFV